MSKKINLEAVSSLKGIGELGLFNRLVDMFLETGKRQIQTIVTAFRDEKWKVLSAEAHSLKSSALSLGAEELADICELLENSEVSLELKTDLIAKLEICFKSTADELTQLKDPT